MYAIVEIAGQQFKVSKDQKVFVHRLAENEGNKVSFDRVLLLDDNGTVTLGAPAIEGASVEAKVLQHLKGDKVIVFIYFLFIYFAIHIFALINIISKNKFRNLKPIL